MNKKFIVLSVYYLILYYKTYYTKLMIENFNKLKSQLLLNKYKTEWII